MEALQLSGGLVGKGDGQNGPGGGGLQTAQVLDGLHIPPVGGVVLQGGQILRRHPLRDLRAVGAPAVLDQICNPVNKYGGFAAARSGQQQQGALCGQHGLLLLGVQVGEFPGDGPAAGGAETQFLFLIQHWLYHPFQSKVSGCLMALGLSRSWRLE